MAEAGVRSSGHQLIGGITGLRALAVLSVTLFHINPEWLPGGFVGVDVFFVISGFVVAHSVSGVRKASFAEYFLWFYRRRFLRILPAIFLYVLVVTVLGILVLPTSEVTKYIEVTGVSALFGASNFALLWKAGDYFAATSEYNSFTHTWSLAVEEQYYMLFPFFSYFMIIREGVTPRARTVMIALAWGACLISLVLAAWLTTHMRDFAFYMLPTRLWELGIGFMLRYQGGTLAGRFGGQNAGGGGQRFSPGSHSRYCWAPSSTRLRTVSRFPARYCPVLRRFCCWLLCGSRRVVRSIASFRPPPCGSSAISAIRFTCGTGALSS